MQDIQNEGIAKHDVGLIVFCILQVLYMHVCLLTLLSLAEIRDSRQSTHSMVFCNNSSFILLCPFHCMRKQSIWNNSLMSTFFKH